MNLNPDISVVIPFLNEEESLPELVQWIDKVMVDNSFSYEIVLIDDGSTDNSWKLVTQMSEKNSRIIGLKFQRNYGKSAALNVGFKQAQGNVVITMDADLQDSPEEIPDLYKMIMEDGYDLVSGWKKKRYDPLMKTIPTKFFNWWTRRLSKIKLHDFNCGLKAYAKRTVKNIEVYGEMHRYIPVIAKWRGYKKIGEKVVQHQARKYGKSKFGMERFIRGFLDLISITFVSKFRRRPMHFFGLWGTIMFMVGFTLLIILGVDKLWVDTSARLITDRPYFYISLVAMILGTMFFLTGFLGEMIALNNPNRNDYIVSDKTESAGKDS